MEFFNIHFSSVNSFQRQLPPYISLQNCGSLPHNFMITDNCPFVHKPFCFAQRRSAAAGNSGSDTFDVSDPLFGLWCYIVSGKIKGFGNPGAACSVLVNGDDRVM